MDYSSVAQAKGLRGLRLVLTAGVPGPWGESAKHVFGAKKIPYTAVRQTLGDADPELRAWTGQLNAPLALYDDEPARSSWLDILALAERLAPEPRLVPTHLEDRVRMFGFAQLICGTEGLGWQRRLSLIHAGLRGGGPREMLETLGARYGYSPAAGEAAPARTIAILELLARELRTQRARGSHYFVGGQLTAVDLYWAAFSVILDVPAEPICPPVPSVRAMYALAPGPVRAALDPILLEQRDRILREHVALPLDF